MVMVLGFISLYLHLMLQNDQEIPGKGVSRRRDLSEANLNPNPKPGSTPAHNTTSTLPEGLIFQTPEEKNYLKLHKCRDGGEAYAAAYLTTKEHLLYQNTAFNLSMVNCEMGSFIMMYSPKRSNDEPFILDGSVMIMIPSMATPNPTPNPNPNPNSNPNPNPNPNQSGRWQSRSLTSHGCFALTNFR